MDVKLIVLNNETINFYEQLIKHYTCSPYKMLRLVKKQIIILLTKNKYTGE